GKQFGLKSLSFTRWGELQYGTDLYCAYLDYDRGVPVSLPAIIAAARIVGLRIVWIELQRSRHGWHVRVRFNTRSPLAEIVCFQACVGSDRRRELLNLMRVRAIRVHRIRSRFWRERANILYSRKLR